MIGLMQGNLVSGRKQASSIRKGGRREPVKFPKGDGGDSDTDSGMHLTPSLWLAYVFLIHNLLCNRFFIRPQCQTPTSEDHEANNGRC